MNTPHPLNPRLLAQAPELAALALLEEALHLATLALVAEHPTLGNDDLDPDPSPTLRLARRLVWRLPDLHRLLQRYRGAVDNVTQQIVDDDVPF